MNLFNVNKHAKVVSQDVTLDNMAMLLISARLVRSSHQHARVQSALLHIAVRKAFSMSGERCTVHDQKVCTIGVS